MSTGGITEVTSADIASARDMDAVVKFVAICELSEDEGSVGVRVHPAMLPRSHPLASVRARTTPCSSRAMPRAH